ncbi:MAG: SDR family oxidoreductase [Acidihalobacter sp.]|uniref:SDR family oxidoreductase n=1 Tax=Acidihalobacter sp. TaxID=1872108 RepID=UPI00307D5E84
MSDILLVTGASGHFGRRVIDYLLNTLDVAPERVVATTRKPENLADLSERGVEVRAADFDDANTLAAAFSGTDRALLISTDALDRPGHRLAQHRAAVAAAQAAGLQHVVYTSMPKPEHSPLLFAPDHAGTEQALEQSALPGWTVLRNHWYFENLFMSMPSILASGQWFSAAGNGRIAHIARDDLARAAATTLANGGDGKNVYTLSGAQAFTTEEIAQHVSTATGAPIQVVHVPLDALVQGMVEAGLPEPMVRIFASFDSNTAAGGVTEVTNDYQRIIGREPLAFDAWLQANAAALSGK